jgi:hypothetical protein
MRDRPVACATAVHPEKLPLVRLEKDVDGIEPGLISGVRLERRASDQGPLKPETRRPAPFLHPLDGEPVVRVMAVAQGDLTRQGRKKLRPDLRGRREGWVVREPGFRVSHGVISISGLEGP